MTAVFEITSYDAVEESLMRTRRMEKMWWGQEMIGPRMIEMPNR